MANQRERLERTLHGCAEAGVPDNLNLWPEIDGRLEERAVPEFDRSSRRTPFSPRTRAGWALVGFVALFALGTGAYAAGGIMDVLDHVFGDTVPYVQKHELGVPVGEKMTKEGATVTIDRIYADQRYVVVGFHVDGLDRLGDGPRDLRDDLLADARLTDPTAGTGEEFVMTDGYWRSWVPPDEAPPNIPTPPKGSQVGTVVFQAPKQLEPGDHRFRIEVGLFRGGSQESIARPFVFDLEVPVRPAPTVEVNQTVESNGVPITLTRVVNSPARSYAFLCFDPPEGKYDLPAVKTGLFGLRAGHLADVPANHPGGIDGATLEGCATYNFGETLYDKPGTHRLTVTALYPSDPGMRGSVEGPWRFRFEVPDR